MVNTRNVNKYDIKDIIIYIGMLTKLAFVALMVHDTIHDKYSHTCMTKNVSKMPLTLRHVQKTHDITVQTFLKESMLTPFILYTVMNECCRAISVHHALYNHYHSNTTLYNFYINKNLQCHLEENAEKEILTNNNKYDDYNMFFDEFQMSFIGTYPSFNKIFEMYRKSFMTKI